MSYIDADPCSDLTIPVSFSITGWLVNYGLRAAARF